MALTTLLSLLLLAQGPCPVELPDGQSIRGGFSGDPGLPVFTVHNRRTDHAYVKLEDIATGDTHVFFVRRQSSVAIDSIVPGSYEVSIAMDGRLGGDCTRLVQAKSVTRFTAPFEFYRRETRYEDGSTGVEIGDNWVELSSASRDAAGAAPITLDRFNR